ncbi:MAG: sulfatase [Kiritimatiellales bacterium]|nr:sulfatase [Kiritimatiellales bacterium]
MKMNPWLLTCLLAVFSAGTANAAVPQSPNIILILSDDQGYGDLGCYGAKDLDTPVIDRLAADGIRFTDAHVTAPQCGPSRCGLMTGIHQQRLGFEANVDDKYAWSFGFQDGKTTTVAALLKDAGYRTGMVGKWHLGEPLDSQPFANGFDCCRYMRGGMGYFWPANLGEQQTWGQKSHKPGWWGDRFRNEKDEVVPWTEGYITDVFTDKAIEFVSAKKTDDRPFFLYLAYNAPHWRLEAPQEIIDRFATIEDPVRRTFAAMVKSMDSNIGRLLAKLDELGIRDNTLIVFLSDNGAPSSGAGYNAGSNGPLKGAKGSLYEGGMRVPMIFNWPARLKAGQVAEWPVISLDLLPTFLAVAGAATPEEKDGTNLLPGLLPEVAGKGPAHVLRWRYLTSWARQYAIRDGDWKLVSPKTGMVELYRMSDDIGEQHDLSSEYPEVRDRLSRDLDTWMDTLPERPKWIDKLHGE